MAVVMASGYAESGAAGQFILHGNTADRMLLRLHDGPKLGRLDDYLLDVLLPRFQVVLGYDPGFGLRVERGRELFALFRQHAAVAEQGASPLFAPLPHPLP